jgi:hypothetical protein
MVLIKTTVSRLCARPAIRSDHNGITIIPVMESPPSPSCHGLTAEVPEPVVDDGEEAVGGRAVVPHLGPVLTGQRREPKVVLVQHLTHTEKEDGQEPKMGREREHGEGPKRVVRRRTGKSKKGSYVSVGAPSAEGAGVRNGERVTARRHPSGSWDEAREEGENSTPPNHTE